ncbi:hypothetical protein B6U70_00940 [Euryarchaeota archaeon ex4484_162]|nr:MAG: hypothetical protein B6U70_00940 [Euryarchaeota archaeon ex4484_162]RLF62792.1 MAG: hypothetical protein DRN16_00595 [Thermoplasmata archaeon]
MLPVKDRIVTWYIQNVIIPRREIIDKPGFVITSFTEKNQITYLRELFIPEGLFELIERKIIQHYNREGKQVLYSAGKKFGYLYASISNFPTIKTCTKKEFTDFAYLLVRYIEGVYARQAKHKLEIENKLFTISFKDYIVCRHNGFGYIMTAGGIAGIWAYAVQNNSVEGVQIECQGRGDSRCFIICADEREIQKRSNSILSEKNLFAHKFDEIYKTMNEVRKTSYSKNSLKDLLDSNFFEYKRGILSYKNVRFFPVEAHILYLLEQEIIKLKNGEKHLFDICFEYGKILREIYGEKDYERFISDFFPALGFGDILFVDSDRSNKTIAAIYYPWTVFSEKSKYIIFRGLMSGIVSSSIGEKIEFRNFETHVGDYLTLIIKQ